MRGRFKRTAFSPQELANAGIVLNDLGFVIRAWRYALGCTQNEWGIARVARLTGPSRGTIYARIARFGIQQQKVRKAPSRRRQLSL